MSTVCGKIAGRCVLTQRKARERTRITAASASPRQLTPALTIARLFWTPSCRRRRWSLQAFLALAAVYLPALVRTCGVVGRLRGAGGALPTPGMEGSQAPADKGPPTANLGGKEPQPGKVRQKMAVGEGRSMMHWLNQRPSIKRQRWVTMEEVKAHNTTKDAWSVFRGKVYDCTAFFDYHPGGPQFMQAVAGKDGTKLFDKYHAWVNVDFIMEKCLVGYLKEDELAAAAVQEEDGDGEEEDDLSEFDMELERNTRLNAAVADGAAEQTCLDEMD